jgi:hypothetical protein
MKNKFLKVHENMAAGENPGFPYILINCLFKVPGVTATPIMAEIQIQVSGLQVQPVYTVF